MWRGDIVEEYVKRLDVAQAHFEWATDPEAIDAAIHELKAAELALSHYVKWLKKDEEEGITNDE